MSKQYFYKLVKEGKGPVISGEGRPLIALEDALLFAQERMAATSESYRDRWEDGIRLIRIDMVLARNAQDKADAEARRREKQEKLASYDAELAEWNAKQSAFLKKGGSYLPKKPAHPFEPHRERVEGPSDWLSSVSLPSH